jgi:hypothetical protein
LLDGAVEDALVDVEQARPQTAAEGVTARLRGLKTAGQPAQRFVLAGVFRPGLWTALAVLEFVKDDFEEKVRRKGWRAGLTVGGKQVGEVEGGDGTVDASSEVVRGQPQVEFLAFGVRVRPGLAEALAGGSAALAQFFGACGCGWGRGRRVGGGGKQGQG